MITVIIGKIIGFFVSVAGIAFFESSETALTSALSGESLCSLQQKYPHRAKSLMFWQEQFNRILTVILIGTNLCHIGAIVLISSLAWQLSNLSPLWSPLIISGVPIIATLFILYFAEILPKIYGKIYAEKIALLVLPILEILAFIFNPLAKVLIGISDIVLVPLRTKLAKEIPFPRIEEFRTLLQSREIENIMEKEDRKMLRNLIEFGDTLVKEAMVPRVHIFAVNLKEENNKIIDQIIQSGFSRIPVYTENIDNITGIIYARDLLNTWRNQSLFLINDFIRPAFFVPETKKVNELLHEFKKGHQHMAIVVDEFGGTAGLVTIEDLVEEIFGEIYDEYDQRKSCVLPLPDSSYIVLAESELISVNRELNLNLPVGEFNTVNGWILDLFGKVPKVGETKYWNNWKIEIIEATSKRVVKIKLAKRS